MSEHKHAKFAPSSSERWLNCNASVDYKDEDETNDAALFGTEVHEWLAQGAGMAEPFTKWTEEQKQDAILCWVDWRKHVPDEAESEVRLVSKDFPDLFFGTADAILKTGTKIELWDLKTGLRGVSVDKNAQLMCYALLAADKYPDAETFHVTIIQPRRFYKDTVIYSRADIEEFRDRVNTAISSASTFVPGTHCEFCPARDGCPALQDTIKGIFFQARIEGLIELKNA